MGIVKARDTWDNERPTAEPLSAGFTDAASASGAPGISLSRIARENRQREFLGGYNKAGLAPEIRRF